MRDEKMYDDEKFFSRFSKLVVAILVFWVLFLGFAAWGIYELVTWLVSK